MKNYLISKGKVQDLSLLMRSSGGDEDEDGGGTDANPTPPDYADPDSQA
jgi:hypothetical protein